MKNRIKNLNLALSKYKNKLVNAVSSSMEGRKKYENLGQSVYGVKLRMTQDIHTGKAITPVLILPNRILRKKGENRSLYAILNIGSSLTNPNRGVLRNFNVNVKKLKLAMITESYGEALKTRSISEEYGTYDIVDIEKSFFSGDIIDVQGFTKGKGWSGVMKKYNFKGGSASHGNSKAHRSAGGIGGCQDPGRVFPGKKMSGRYGNVKRTMQNLLIKDILKYGDECNILRIYGSIPGPKNALVRVRHAIKKTNNQTFGRDNL